MKRKKDIYPDFIMDDTFVCQRCLQAGQTEKQATFSGADAYTIEGLSDPVCPHCAIVEKEG